MLREGHQSLWGETEDIFQNPCAPQEVSFLPHMPGMNAELALSAWEVQGQTATLSEAKGGPPPSPPPCPPTTDHGGAEITFCFSERIHPPHLPVWSWVIIEGYPQRTVQPGLLIFLKRQKLQVLKIVACTKRLQIHDKNPQKVTIADSSGECHHACPVWLRCCVLAGEFIQESY